MLITSKGFTLAGITIPSFELMPGTVLTLSWPAPHGSKSETAFYDLLMGKKSHEGLLVRAQITIAMPNDLIFVSSSLDAVPLDSSVFLPMLHQGGITDTRTKVSNLPLTMRCLIAIELACSRSIVVVFHTAGLDPIGEGRIADHVKGKTTAGWSFLCLRFPLFGEVPSRNATLIL